MSSAPDRVPRKPPRARDQPLSAAAQAQSGGLVAVGTRTRWRKPSAPTSRSCSRSATPPATGATSWRTRASRTTPPRAVMNELFVNIKVDREERPDIDQIYMSALHHLGEHGGWPLTMFLTPARRAVLGRHLFPEDRALRQARLRRRAARGRARVPRGAAERRAEPQRADGAAGGERAARRASVVIGAAGARPRRRSRSPA